MEHWQRSFWMVTVPDQQVSRVVSDILDRYIDTITMALTDMREHVTMGSPTMTPYHDNALWAIVEPVVHETSSTNDTTAKHGHG